MCSALDWPEARASRSRNAVSQRRGGKVNPCPSPSRTPGGFSPRPSPAEHFSRVHDGRLRKFHVICVCKYIHGCTYALHICVVLGSSQRWKQIREDPVAPVSSTKRQKRSRRTHAVCVDVPGARTAPSVRWRVSSNSVHVAVVDAVDWHAPLVLRCTAQVL